MYMTQGLHRAVQGKPDKIATIFGDRRRTYRQLGDRVSRLAAGLVGLGVRPNDRVGMLALNSDRFLEYYLATYWAGGAVNPVNIRWSPAEIAYSLDDCATSVLIVDDQFLPMIPEIRERSRLLTSLVYAGDGRVPAGMASFEDLIDGAKPIEDARRGGSDLAGILYTGGTTGFPKGVMLAHAGLYMNSLIYLAERILADPCIGLHAAPMFHLADGGFSNALVAQGATHVMVPRFEAKAVLEAIHRERVTDSLAVPTMIQMLIEHPDFDRYDVSSFRGIVYGASPISEALMDRALEKFPKVAFTQLYGMTELSPIATVLPAQDHHGEGRRKGRHRSAGRACVGAEVRIIDPEGREVPRGSPGEIAVRGAGVMLGYWNKPQETAAAVRDGWMHTGDGGVMDEDGYVYVVDRLKDMIVTGGENVYSVEVENAIVQHPSVSSAAVIGVPDAQWGERVYAFVVLRQGAKADEAQIIAHCRQLIANYKCPREVAFIDTLPLSGAGKVLKSTLREPFWKGERRNVA